MANRNVKFFTTFVLSTVIILDNFGFSKSAPITNTESPSDSPSINRTDSHDYDQKNSKSVELDRNLRDFFENYYEKFIKKKDFEEIMQSDQPADDGNSNNVNVLPSNSLNNFSSSDFLQASRNRTKDNWIQMLKMNILHQVGRVNSTNLAPGESRSPSFNSTFFHHHRNPNETNQDDLISKKIRTFYPSCSVPDAAEAEFLNEDKLMNLFFNYTEEDSTRKIATATIRLHRIPMENSSLTVVKPRNCSSSSSNEEEKLLRVSIFWYIKPQRNKRRVKKRLCDSRVISENARWVELNVANAIRAWNKEPNLGVAVQVEDPDGRTLKAEKYFRGPTCLVGITTPQPIPTILVDDVRTTEQLYKLLGRNSTSAVSRDLLLLPAVDVCTLGFPVGYEGNAEAHALKNNACNLRQLHAQAQKLLEKDRLERLSTFASKLRPTLSSPSTSTFSSSGGGGGNHRHLRHQKNYLAEKIAESDTRILMTKEQVFELLKTMNITNNST